MALKENPVLYLNIDPGKWGGKPEGQIIDELASIFAETNLEINYTEFSYSQEGKLVDKKGKPLRKQMENTTPLGKLEVEGFEKIESWGWNDGEGVSAWISAPHPSRSNFAKIGLSEVVQGGPLRKMVSRFMLLDLPGEHCVALAKAIDQYSLHKQRIPLDAEELRSAPVLLKIRPGLHWTRVLEEIVPNEYWGQIRRGEDIVTQEKINRQAEEFYKRWAYEIGRTSGVLDGVFLGLEMQANAKRLGYLGQNGGSCPTAYQLFSGETGFPCPQCHKNIPSGRGITTCPHCGITKEEAGSKCA